ncbi:MAG: hypothetical protein ACOC1X_01795 [Promethearchaeota archaeon]
MDLANQNIYKPIHPFKKMKKEWRIKQLLGMGISPDRLYKNFSKRKVDRVVKQIKKENEEKK